MIELGMGFTDSWILIIGIGILVAMALAFISYYIDQNRRG
jgi:hypothetical protein